MSFAVHLRARARSLLAVSVAAVTVLTACGTSDDNDEKEETDSGDFPVTIEHAMGETAIKSAPKTVVTLDQSYLDAAVALKMDVVGRTDYPDGGDVKDYLGDDGEKYAGDAELVGSLEEPDLAKIAELEPDLIVSAKVRHEEVYDQLSAIAPTVFSETVGASWKNNLRLLGKAVGKKSQANSSIAAYEDRATKIGTRIKKKNDGTMPSVTLARFAGEPTVRMYSPHSFFGVVQRDVGLARPKDAPKAKEDEIMVPLSQERILDLDADHIFVSVWNDGTGDAQKKADRFTENPLWGKLKGEKHNVNDDVWVSSTSLQGANGVLDDLADTFGVKAAE